MTLHYSPHFNGETFRQLPLGKPVFESIVGNAGLLEFLELRLGLPGVESKSVDRIIAYRDALQSCLSGAFYEDAFNNDPLAAAKEILRWRDTLVLDGFSPDSDYKSPRLRKLAEVDKAFRRAALIGTPERWLTVRERLTGPISHTDIRVWWQMNLLPKVIREILAVAEARDADNNVTPIEGRSVEILRFNEVIDAYRWAVDNNNNEVVICPDTYRLNGVLRSKGMPLADASSTGSSSSTKLLILGLSLLERPMDVNKLADYLRATYSPLPGKLRFRLADALMSDGGKGEAWDKALEKYYESLEESEVAEDKTKFATFISALLDADVQNGMVDADVVTNWCQALGKSAKEKGRIRLSELCDALNRVLERSNEKTLDVESLIRTAKTLDSDIPETLDKAQAGGWVVVDSHRCFIDTPESLLWMPCNRDMETPYPYDFLLNEEREELDIEQIATFIRHDFAQLSKLLAATKRIVLYVCDFDCGEALEEHPAVTLLRPFAKEKDMRNSSTSPRIFKPIGTLEVKGTDLYPREIKDDGSLDYYPLSPTGFEELVGYPFDYVMKKTLKFHDISDVRLPALNITEGTVAHAVFEGLMKDGGKTIPGMRRLLTDGTFYTRVEEVAEKEGAILLLPENRSVFLSFRDTLQDSIKVLLDILESSKLKPGASEEPFDEILDCGRVKGFVDFYAETVSGDIVIIDFKYSSGSVYIDKLKGDKAIQLEFYAQALEKKLGKKVVATAYYFFPKCRLHTTDSSGVFKGKHVILEKPKPQPFSLKDRIDKSAAARKSELESGVLEVEEGSPVEVIDWHNNALDGSLLDTPAKSGKKAFKPFSEPNLTTFPILKNQIK